MSIYGSLGLGNERVDRIWRPGSLGLGRSDFRHFEGFDLAGPDPFHYPLGVEADASPEPIARDLPVFCEFVDHRPGDGQKFRDFIRRPEHPQNLTLFHIGQEKGSENPVEKHP